MERGEERLWGTADTVAMIAIVAAAMILRLIFAAFVHPLPVSDSGWYMARALEIAAGRGYAVHGLPTAYWPPGWPYFLAAEILIFGKSLMALAAVQSVLNSLTAGLAFLIGRRLFGRSAGILAGLAYAVLPSAVEWSSTLISEPLYTLLLVFVTYLWVSRPTANLAWYALGGTCIGFASLVRPSALLFGLVLLLYLLSIASERRKPVRLAAAVLITFLFTAFAITPTLARNYRVFGTFVLISNNGGVSLYQTYNPHSNGGYTELDNPEIARLIANPRTEVQADRLASRLAVHYIASHFERDLVIVFKNFKGLYATDDLPIRFTLRSSHFRERKSPPPSDVGATRLLYLNRTMYYTVMVLALAGIITCIIRHKAKIAPQWRVLALIIAYNTAMFAIAGGNDRFRYPTMPDFAIFAGAAAVALYELFSRRTGFTEARAPT